MAYRTRQIVETRLPLIIGYGLMIAGTVLLYLVIRSYGEVLIAPAPNGSFIFGSGRAHGQADVMLHVLLALVVVIVMARTIGTLFRRFQQPPVVGEIVAGILLGPSLLGRVAPGAFAYLLPPAVAPFLNVISQVGVILYMFLVGLELDPGLLKKRGHSAVAISHASIILPFLLGATLALLLYPRLSTRDVPFTCFSLFLGVSMAVTAFPVLARILTDRRMHTSRMGAIALTCAAVDDITAWCLLAFVVGVVEARAAGAMTTAAMAIGYIAVMIFVVRPLMARLALYYGNRGRLTQGVMATIFVVLLLSAIATDMIGIHAIFGAFAFGAMIPHDSGMARDLTDRLEDLVIVLLLPAFFAFTGLRTEIGLLRGPEEWLFCGLIVLVASMGKFGGTALAARLTGLGWRDSSALGVLMNTRGLMELIVLNIGLELRVISPELFAMLVLMAIVTTFATTPILHVVTRGEAAEQPPEARAAKPEFAPDENRPVLVPISNPEGVAPLLGLALAICAPSDPPPRVIALLRRPSGGVRSGLREVEQRVIPRVPIVTSALEYAQARDEAISANAIWTDEPADDIVREARELLPSWILLGRHRPVFGADYKGGVVRSVLARLRELPVHVGIVVHGGEQPLDRVVTVVDQTADGRAALDLAVRIARRKKSRLHAVLISESDAEPDGNLAEMLRAAGRTTGRWLHTDVMTERSAAQLLAKTSGSFVIVGMNLADDLGLPLDDSGTAGKCVVVVRGALTATAQSEAPRDAWAAESGHA